MRKFKIGDRVKGDANENEYEGTIVYINNNGKKISVLRDDEQRGSGDIYKGNHTWLCCLKPDGEFGGSDRTGTLKLLKINDWEKEFMEVN